MEQPDLKAVPPGGELEPREGIDRHCVGADAADVAEGDVGAARLQQRADTLTEPGQIGARDGAADREGDRLRH